MIHDPWFWLSWVLLIVAWGLFALAWYFRWLAKRKPPLLPTVTADTMTSVHLQLALRRLLVIMEDEHHSRPYGEWSDQQVKEAKKLLAGTDFEVR
jgi:hypothetical protein